MRTVVERNGLWNNALQQYVTVTVKNCSTCIALPTPPPSRKVSLSTLSCNFNEVVEVDHFYLDHYVRLIHFMDTVSRYSGYHICTTENISDAIVGLQTCWLNQF